MTANATEFAPAKLNLCLHVCGRREDGYHLLDTLVVFAEIGDRLSVQPTEGLDLEMLGPMAPALDGLAARDNLVLRAARALQVSYGVLEGAHLVLEKHLPAGAGLGGGSADAGAALRLLARFWRLAPPAEDLARLALTLGADVPVCLAGRPTRVTGIGETLSPFAPPPGALWAVLAFPGAPLATADVFGSLTPAERAGAPLPPVPRLRDAADLLAYLAGVRNDLEAPACRLMPGIADLLAALRAAPGCRLARMSGSGSACFGLFVDAAPARAVAAALEARGLWTRAGRILA